MGFLRLAWIKMDNDDTEDAMKLFNRLLTECPDSKLGCQAAMARAKFMDDKGTLPGGRTALWPGIAPVSRQ